MVEKSRKPVRAVVLAAGQGKRMKSSCPKVLHKVLGRAILSRVIDALDQLDIEKIHIVVGHGAGEVQSFLASYPPAHNWSVHVQQMQLGTGHALQQVAPDLNDFQGTLLVTVADIPLITPATLTELIFSQHSKNAIVSLLTTMVPDAKHYGRIIRDLSGHILRIVEDKDATVTEKAIKEINPAIYCFEWPTVSSGLKSLTNNNEQKEYYLTDLIGWAVNEKLQLSSAYAADWREVAGINSRLELAEAEHFLKEKTLRKLALDAGVTIIDPQSTWIAPEVKIGQDTVVRPGCYMVGDIQIGSGCLIGPHTVMEGSVEIGQATEVFQSLVVDSQIGDHCRVGPFAHLRGQSVVSDHVRIGNFVEIKNSQVGSSTNISHLSYVGDAEIGQKANVGAGTITANYDHISKIKSKTIIGDGASTGSNSVLVAPVTIGKEAVVAAGVVVTRDVPDGALALGRARQENKPGWVERKKDKAKPLTKNG